jgi:ribosomal protein S18 acetylase RimI-like enzyme
LCLLAEHESSVVGLLSARHDVSRGVIEVLDVRVDYDFRREGIATAMMYQLLTYAREQASRAIRAQSLSNNLPFNSLLAKVGFEINGIDLRYRSNHDLVKEQATIIWYLPLEDAGDH